MPLKKAAAAITTGVADDKLITSGGMKKMAVSRVTRNYQVTVPREIRETCDIREGDVILFTREEGAITLRKVDKSLMAKCFGIWKRPHVKAPWLVDKILKGEAEKRLKGLIARQEGGPE